MLYIPDLMPEEVVRYDTAERVSDEHHALIQQQAKLRLAMDEAAYNSLKRINRLRADEAARIAEIRYGAKHSGIDGR